VGRARHQASALSRELRKLGATVLEIPFIEIREPRSFRPLDAALQNLAGYDWLILTSVNGVEAMWERLRKLRLTKRNLQYLRIAAIGPATKKAIEQRGGKVDVVPKEYVAESVVRSLRRRVKGKRVLLVRAKVARDVIPTKLRKAGALVDVVEAYETVVPQLSRARLRKVLANPQRRPHVITFTSSSTAKNFVTLLGKQRPGFDNVLFASIGPVTSTTLREMGLPVDIETKEYTIPGLVEAIVTRTTSPPPPVAIRANLRMQHLLKGTTNPGRLTPKLRAVLDAGFIEKDGCLLLASEAVRSFGGDPTDSVGYESFVNHIHFANFPQAWLYANQLAKRLNLSRWGECAVIVSYDGKDATVLFHRIRSDRSWLAEDLEEYREEAIAVLNSR
jgi:uroporphyrinogen-III synthase